MVDRLLSSSDTSLAFLISGRFALDSFRRAAARVPAYREFLSRHGLNPNAVATPALFDQLVPQTRKDNYITKYPFRELCLDGKLPEAGAIDESAGSTGKPHNWVRSARELAFLRETFHMGLRHSFGYTRTRPSIVINTYSCGAWAAGFRLGVSLEPWSLVKNTGPDKERVYHTLEFFGPAEHYLMAGYPPFLKELVHHLKVHAGLDLKRYRIDIMSGGEGFPRGWRRYMRSELSTEARIVSAYGASDLEMGIASETPYSTDILDALLSDPALRADLLGTEREPVFFGQYNPSGHYVRSVRNGRGQSEIEITILSRYSHSPRIKYCVGDEGGTLGFEHVKRVTSGRGFSISASEIALPFIYLFGRCDGTVSIDGANIYPDLVHAAIFDNLATAAHIQTFKMGVSHPESGTARLKFILQAVRGVQPTERLTQECKIAIVQRLLMGNSDFKESFRANPASADPVVEVVPFDSELFAKGSDKIKNSYFL